MHPSGRLSCQPTRRRQLKSSSKTWTLQGLNPNPQRHNKDYHRNHAAMMTQCLTIINQTQLWKIRTSTLPHFHGLRNLLSFLFNCRLRNAETTRIKIMRAMMDSVSYRAQFVPRPSLEYKGSTIKRPSSTGASSLRRCSTRSSKRPVRCVASFTMSTMINPSRDSLCTTQGTERMGQGTSSARIMYLFKGSLAGEVQGGLRNQDHLIVSINLRHCNRSTQLTNCAKCKYPISK